MVPCGGATGASPASRKASVSTRQVPAVVLGGPASERDAGWPAPVLLDGGAEEDCCAALDEVTTAPELPDPVPEDDAARELGPPPEEDRPAPDVDAPATEDPDANEEPDGVTLEVPEEPGGRELPGKVVPDPDAPDPDATTPDEEPPPVDGTQAPSLQSSPVEHWETLLQDRRHSPSRITWVPGQVVAVQDATIPCSVAAQVSTRARRSHVIRRWSVAEGAARQQVGHTVVRGPRHVLSPAPWT